MEATHARTVGETKPSGPRPRRVLRYTISFLLLLIVAGGLTFYTEPLWVNDQMIRYKLRRQHVDSTYVQVDGYSIHYFEAHPPQGPGRPLILIHGIGSRGEDWAPMIAPLAAQGFHVYVPDLLGYGRSPQPDVDYSISLEQTTVQNFMDALHIQKADVGGWSMGGWIALRMALDHPDRVNRLVVYDAAGIYFPPTFDASLFVPSDAAGLATLRHILSPINNPFPAFVSRSAVQRLQHNAWVIERSFYAMENGRDLMDFRLNSIRVPTLIVWGSVDQLIPLAVGQRMRDAIPNSSLVTITGCGHLAPSECPVPVLKATTEFLKSDQPPTPHEFAIDGTVAPPIR